MWKYSKKLQYPINIRNKNLKMAKAVMSQYGGAGKGFDQKYLQAIEVMELAVEEISGKRLRKR